MQERVQVPAQVPAGALRELAACIALVVMELSRRRAVVRSQYLLSASEAGDVPSLHHCSDRWRQQEQPTS